MHRSKVWLSKRENELFRLFGFPNLNVHLRGSNIETMREYFPEDYMIFMRIMAIQSRDEYESGLRVVHGIQSGTYTKDIAWSLENEHRALQSLKRHAEIWLKRHLLLPLKKMLNSLGSLMKKWVIHRLLVLGRRNFFGQQKIIVEMRRRSTYCCTHLSTSSKKDGWGYLTQTKPREARNILCFLPLKRFLF